MSFGRARQQAQRLIQQQGIAKPPVDVDAVAKRLGLAIVRTPLGGDISGLLITKGGTTTICVEASHHEHRQRFTVAHEIGHHVLGHHFAGEHVHVDRVSMRNGKSSEGSDVREIEANQFAACLLMPEQLVHEKMRVLASRDLENVVKQLARAFKVSEQALAFRLGVLGYEAT